MGGGDARRWSAVMLRRAATAKVQEGDLEAWGAGGVGGGMGAEAEAQEGGSA